MRTAVETVFSLLTLAEVGSSLDDTRPTLVLAAGTGELRFVNAAAATMLGITALDPVFGTVSALDASILRQTLRFAERAPAGASGLELIRVPNGLRTAVLGCRMTHLGAPAGEPAVLLRLEGVVTRAGAHDIAASLALLAAEDRLLAAFDAEGEVLAASGDYALLEGSQDEIEDFVVAAAESALARKTVRRGDALSEALVVRIGGERELRLIAIEPTVHAPVDSTEVPVAVPAPPPAATAIEPDHMLDPIFFALSPLPTPDDYAAWQADARREAAAAPASPETEAEVAAFSSELGRTAAGSAADARVQETDDTSPAAAAGPDTTDEDRIGTGDAGDGIETPGAEPAGAEVSDLSEPAGEPADIPGAEPAVVPEDGALLPPFPGASPEDLRFAVELVTGAAGERLASETTGPGPGSEPAPELPSAPAAAVVAAVVSTEPTVDAVPTPATGPVAAGEDGFVFAPESRPRRFVWQMDAAERFTFVSEDFRAAVGPRAADLVGSTWADLRARLGVDRDGIVAAALARRDTWSGLTALWPVEGEALRIPVDLAALPAFGRRREFEGYRGFGVCRTVEAVPDPSGTGLRILLEDLVPESADAGPAGPSAERAGLPDEPASDRNPAPNVVSSVLPLPTTDVAAEQTVDGESPATAAVGPLEAASPEPATLESASPSIAAIDAPDETEAPIEFPSTLEPDEPEAAFAGEIDRPGAEPGTPDGFGAVRPTASGPDAAAQIEPGPKPAIASEPASPTPEPIRPDRSAESRIVTVPANRGSRIVTLPTAHRTAPDRNRLSGPERIAFRQIAAALGARIEGDDAAPASRAAEPPSDEPPAEDDHPAPAAADVTGAVSGAVLDTVPAPAGRATGTAPAIEEPAADVTEPATAAVPVSDGGAERTERPADEPERGGSNPVAQLGLETALQSPVAVADSFSTSASAGTAHPVAAEPTAIVSEADRVDDTGDSGSTAAEDEIATVIRILDRLPVGCAVLKDDGLAHVNEAFLAMLGYPNRATFETAGGLDAIFAGEHVGRRFVEEGQVRPLPVISRTGAVVPVAARMAGIPWGAGSAVLLTLDRMPRQTIEPVTETVSGRAALDALGEARERANELEAVVDTATDGVLMLDVDGRVISANRAAEALFGMERAEMSGRPLVDLLAPESRRSAQDYLDGLARNGVASVLNDGREVIGQVPPDGLIPLFMTIGRISSGKGSKFCAVLRDITQWKKSEEELTGARRRAEEASSHKSEFLAKISHEIRTPLNAIIGFSEVMLDERFGPIGSDRYKDYLRDIHTSGSHIMSLINDLLDLSKVEAGKMELKFEAVSLADIAGECVALMQPQANRERIIIRTSLPSGVPAVVADGRSIRQIVLNLLSNAVKFTPAGGQVIVSTALEDSGEVVVRVRDTGFGMSEKEIQAALEPFRQLHTTRVRSGGTGLGLPLTKALVEANRATFRIDSVVNQGTLVSITFPVTRVLAG